MWDLAGGLSSSTTAALLPCHILSQCQSHPRLAHIHSVLVSFFFFDSVLVLALPAKSDRWLPISPPLTMSTMWTPQPTAGLLEAASQGGKIWNKEKLANRTKKHCGKEKKRGKRARLSNCGIYAIALSTLVAASLANWRHKEEEWRLFVLTGSTWPFHIVTLSTCRCQL